MIFNNIHDSRLLGDSQSLLFYTQKSNFTVNGKKYGNKNRGQSVTVNYRQTTADFTHTHEHEHDCEHGTLQGKEAPSELSEAR